MLIKIFYFRAHHQRELKTLPPRSLSWITPVKLQMVTRQYWIVIPLTLLASSLRLRRSVIVVLEKPQKKIPNQSRVEMQQLSSWHHPSHCALNHSQISLHWDVLLYEIWDKRSLLVSSNLYVEPRHFLLGFQIIIDIFFVLF